eukprot:CAMPEP_0198234118 /NCGR_PEP_ID=MMETSP1446-20131203/211_1 /TAXON_ID=1461542 ORGANISM="Unidentified sp, Strain CCMP2111" /NCGR_SAMPLE_ID=MMETSP1446 /ASSEMBLY_ACC=CAM_ASM_001112 /LENGTH=1741 /DNA_ID=CAMNT_0043914847 /DNA_START=161 /DNA_END=5386 /DNA_ORIENTATION=-
MKGVLRSRDSIAAAILPWVLLLLLGIATVCGVDALTADLTPEFANLGVSPVAFFPLTKGDLSSSDGKYAGQVVGGDDGGVTWGGSPDDGDVFGTVLECHEHKAGLVQLDSVPYGTNGPFSINFWVKQGQGNTDWVGEFEYIFSHTSTSVTDGPFFPFSENQIHMFLPKVSHPAHGILRAVVKDSTDLYTGSNSQTFLDSDGSFLDNNPRNLNGHVDFEDGKWHMVTLTTRIAEDDDGDEDDDDVDEGNPKGYEMYVDGVLAGEAPPSILWEQLDDGLDSIPGVDADGGNPLMLDGPIHLCGRADRDIQRHFGGKLAHLSLWDDALTPEQIAQMFTEVMGQEKLEQRCVESDNSGWRTNGKDPCPFLAISSAPSDVATPSTEPAQKGAPAGSSPFDTVDTPSSEVIFDVPSEEPGQECAVLEETSTCAIGMVCVPLAYFEAYANAVDAETSATVGRCTNLPIGGVFPPDPVVNVPIPMAFFPLTGNNANSWPDARYKGVINGATWTPDILFESVLDCSEEKATYVKLDNVRYGTEGPFAISFWMRKDYSSADKDDLFEYMFSHGSEDASGEFNPYDKNQLHIFLPEAAHQAHGIIRTVLKDSQSSYTGIMSHTYFDSDGKFMDNSPRDTIGHVDVEDGEWHMYTVTTKPSMEPGFEVYIDGSLGGSYPTPELEEFLTNHSKHAGGLLPQFRVDGGVQPMDINDGIYLCGRSDRDSKRHYDGKLAHLSIFDQPLGNEQVAAMYNAVKGHSLILDSLLDLATNIRSLQPNGNLGMPNPLLTLKDSTTSMQSSEAAAPCTINVLESGIASPAGCGEGLICAALHSDNDGDVIGDQVSGVCVAAPEGGVYVPDPVSALPVPKAYFPLTGGKLESWPVPEYREVVNHGVGWTQDGFFGNVMECKEGQTDYVELQNVDYGKNGNFAVNFWTSYNETEGNTFKFMFSHGQADPDVGPWSPNEVQIYIPEISHPAHGVVRAIVKDSNDLYRGKWSETFLDSDGGYMNNAARNIPGHVDMDDGKWHMVTITTNTDGSKGYSIYVDGVLGGSAPPAFMKAFPSDYKNVSFDGGEVISPSGNIFLCGRNDKNEDRHFGGKLAHLSLFDESLSPKQIMGLYAAGAGEAAVLQRTLGLLLNQLPAHSQEELASIDPLDVAQVGEACFAMPSQYTIEDVLASEAMHKKQCGPGLICTPKASSALSQDQLGFHGSCVEVPSDAYMPEMEYHEGNLFFPTPLAKVPIPYAFFPLTGERLTSWPSPVYSGNNVNGAAWVDDATFGSALQCDGKSFVQLDPVPYASRGAFAVNLWMRNNDSLGDSFEYIFSHAQDDDMGFNPFYPNQLHIYLPEVSHPAHGVIRTIVKDGNDNYEGAQSETFLDSDGILVNNNARNIAGHVNIDDDDWHMVTLTSRADNGQGYAVFVDGVLAATNFLPTLEPLLAPNGLPYNIDGGDAMTLNGHIHLCGRTDIHPERHFKGRLSHLSLYDAALTPDSVAALFISVKGENAFRERLMQLAEARQDQLTSESNGTQTQPAQEDVETSKEDSLICQTDVMQCSDGTWVGRTGPNCEFDCSGRTAVPPPTQVRRRYEEDTTDQQVNAGYGSNNNDGMNGASTVSSESDKKFMGISGMAGLVVGICFIIVIGLLGLAGFFIVRRHRSSNGSGGSNNKMLALPTRSPSVSRNVSIATNRCVDSPGNSACFSSGDGFGQGAKPVGDESLDDAESYGGASQGGLMAQVQSIQAKSKKSQMSQYGELED